MDEIAYMNYIKQEKENGRVARETLKTVLELLREEAKEKRKVNVRRELMMLAGAGVITVEEKRLVEKYCREELQLMKELEIGG